MRRQVVSKRLKYEYLSSVEDPSVADDQIWKQYHVFVNTLGGKTRVEKLGTEDGNWRMDPWYNQ